MRTTFSRATGVSALAFVVLCLFGCSNKQAPPVTNPENDLGGFFVFAYNEVQLGPGIEDVPMPGVEVGGDWVENLTPASEYGTPVGTIYQFGILPANTISTDETGSFYVAEGVLPAIWSSGVVWPVACGLNGETVDSGQSYVTFQNPNITWYCGPTSPGITPATHRSRAPVAAHN